jgi:hypothetical protein
MHGVRAAIPQTSPLAEAEFATIRERLIAHSALELSLTVTVSNRCALFHAVRPMSSEAVGPTNRRRRHINSERQSDCCRSSAQHAQKRAASCIMAAGLDLKRAFP